VVTDLALMGFEAASKRMQIIALHSGVTVDQVQANTGFELEVAAAVATTEPPTEKELAVLRHLDPERLYTA
jgi:glutaconate CoA-transferase, subunit B